VTESLMVADAVDLEAYAHPDAKLTLNDKIERANAGKDDHFGKAHKEKAHRFKLSLHKQQQCEGVFKRGAC